MINKQSVWFVTLFSLILVLAIYYVTMQDSSLQKIIENSQNETSVPVNVDVEESSLLVSLRVQEDEAVLEEMQNYQAVLLDETSTTEEKNNAYKKEKEEREDREKGYGGGIALNKKNKCKRQEKKKNAYNSLMALKNKKSEEEKIEQQIKETHNLDSFVKIKDDTISIVIASAEHDSSLANNIIRTVQSLFDEEKYITVKFQNA